LVGAALLTLLADGTTELVAALGWDVPGLKHLLYGVILFAVVILLPHGIWPVLARKLGINK
jgi:ABC-type branched-subunit amino acid transport system permease subunit